VSRIGVHRMAGPAGAGWSLLRNAHVHPKPRRTPLVSVIIATYNWSSVLRHALRSALWQTYPAVEVIVAGDGCTDDSESVVLSTGDSRVRWENLERNSGSPSAPNNRGIELARGEYVAYLGHDDLWLPTHLVHLVAALERSDAGLALACVQVLGPPGSNVRVITGHRPGASPQWKPPSGVLHRRAVVETVGGWRDYRTLVEPPDREFVERVIAHVGIAHSQALTVCKFSSAWRKDSYRLRRDDEQREYVRRIARERTFVERELLAHTWLRLRRPPKTLPDLGPTPEVVPPGWHVTQWRRIRGLPDEPAG
jgi:glycosyltransferase involved in cell wall biosynthesis